MTMMAMNGAMPTEKAAGMTTAMAMATGMDGTMSTAMEGATAMQQQQQQLMAPQGQDGNDGDGRRDGNGNGNWRLDGNVTSTTAMDSVRATAIHGTMVAQRRGRRDGNTMAT